MPAQNGIIGESENFEMPISQLPDDDLVNEKNMAKFSQSKEFKKLKEHMESRIDFYQSWLPDGQPLGTMSPAELGQRWIIANSIITELRAVLLSYELAKEAVQDAQR